MNFSDLGLSPKVLSGVESAGYETPTPIQAKAIPVANDGRDVLGIAQTGTGKTGAFVLPMLMRLERGRARARMPRSLILEPTRELAAQVVEAFETLGVNHKLTVALLIGGVSFDEQFRKLDRGADVVIATPGRLLDHFQRGKLLLTGIEILVIDEADRMLDMGFIPDIERISKLIPPMRQTLFFSATMPSEIERLANKFLNSPERVEATPPSSIAALIEQNLKFTSSDPKEKRAALRELMQSQDVKNAIVFCNRKRDVATLHRSLVKHGFNAAALHGDLDQHQRTKTLEAFRNDEITYLAASDVAARGLDIPEVSHIFNFDVPVHAEDYVHRIGRTGRAGKKGCAMTLVTASELAAIKAIEELVGKKIAWVGDPPSAEEREEGGRARRGGRQRGKPKRDGTSARSNGSREKRSRPADNKSGGSRKNAKSGKPTGKSAPASKKPSKDSGAKQGMGDHVPAFMTKPIRQSPK
ncbi:MAG: DEAD/DEAH box helicase [Hyphomicrobiales bacterium]|nr:DEAD/DEAH box helicase [Hyphomicrobiales bacterium]